MNWLIELAAQVALEKGLDPEGARAHMRAWLHTDRGDFLRLEERKFLAWSRIYGAQ
jgi:hypothetical protein